MARTECQTDILVALLHPRDRHRKTLAMIEGYLDESGIHQGANVCVIGGYFGGQGQWRKFEKLWNTTLKDFSVEEFHAKRFRARDHNGNRVEPYKNWTDRDSAEFLSALVHAIGRYKIHPVCCGIIVADFHRYSLNQRRYLTGATIRGGKFRSSGCPTKPYFMPFQACIDRICYHTENGVKAHFFCGSDRTLSDYALSLFKHLKDIARTGIREKLGNIDFPEARNTPHLQAADLFSYAMYQESLERLKSGDWTKPPTSLLRGLTIGQLLDRDCGYMDKDNLDEMLSFVSIPQ